MTRIGDDLSVIFWVFFSTGAGVQAGNPHIRYLRIYTFWFCDFSCME
jgi:hypothetical protein